MKIAELIGNEFVVVAANERRMILESESGELFVIESIPTEMGGGESYLVFYQAQMKPLVLA